MSATRSRKIQMPDQLEQLFVYGTLKPTFRNYRRIEKHVRNVRAGTIHGILIDLGAFPAVLHGDGIVKGVVLDVDVEAIRITDMIEGYHPEEGSNHYVREKVVVTLDHGSKMKAWTYFYADPERIQDRSKLPVGEIDGLPIFAWPLNNRLNSSPP